MSSNWHTYSSPSRFKFPVCGGCSHTHSTCLSTMVAKVSKETALIERNRQRKSKKDTEKRLMFKELYLPSVRSYKSEEHGARIR